MLRDTALAEKLADEFIANADEVRMDRAAIMDTFKAYVLVQKLMDHYECNAFYGTMSGFVFHQKTF